MKTRSEKAKMSTLVLRHLDKISKKFIRHRLYFSKMSYVVLSMTIRSRTLKTNNGNNNGWILFARANPGEIDGPALGVNKAMDDSLPTLDATSSAKLGHGLGSKQRHLSHISSNRLDTNKNIGRERMTAGNVHGKGKQVDRGREGWHRGGRCYMSSPEDETGLRFGGCP